MLHQFITIYEFPLGVVFSLSATIYEHIQNNGLFYLYIEFQTDINIRLD